MRRLLPLLPFVLFIGLAAVFFLSIGRDTTLAANGMVGKPFPEFTLQKLVLNDQLESQQYDRATLLANITKGEPWLLNVWASWCPQCYIEHGFIQSIVDAGAEVVGLNYKDSHEKGIGFLQKMGNPYHVVLKDELGTLGLDLGVSGAPETYLVSSDGIILVRYAGALDRQVWDQTFSTVWQQESGKKLLSKQLIGADASLRKQGENK